MSATAHLHLLPEKVLVRTGPVDHALWNYRGVLGRIQTARFRLIRSLMGDTRYQSLLEVGYGSGVFMPELATHADRLSGVDVHAFTMEVNAALRTQGVQANLRQGAAEAIPFDDASFDAIVAVSVFEFVSDMDATCRELLRVLKPTGSLFVVTPGVSPVLDAGLRLLTGKSAKDDFSNRRERVLPALRSHFRVANELRFPAFGIKLYTALELTQP